jgi:hypothetical protein
MTEQKSLWIIILLFAFSTLVSCQSEKQSENETARELTVRLSADERLQKIKDELKLIKADLNKAGRYNCCVHPACDWCVLHEGDCQCHDNLLAKKAVCPDCGLGWHNGHGVVEGVKVSQVKWEITHEHPTGGHKH